MLDNIEPHSTAAFLLPDKKLEKISKTSVKNILKKHKLQKIIKKEDIDVKTFREEICGKILYFSEISSDEKTNNITINIERGEKHE